MSDRPGSAGDQQAAGEDENQENGVRQNNSSAGIGMGIAIGLSIGVSFGIALDNLALGLVFGMAIGIAIGSGLSSSLSSPKNDASTGTGRHDNASGETKSRDSERSS